MINRFTRTELLLGTDAVKKLKSSRVAVFGIGGVGGHAAEALVRSGIGTLDIIDNDKFSITNINRQIFATDKTIGRYKVEAASERLLEINPELKINTYKTFYMPDTSSEFDFTSYDYVIDAIDTVTGKIEIIIQAKKAAVPVISSMGAGNKLNPAAFEVADIYSTSVCPLAKVMRHELKKRGIKSLKTVYSKEPPLTPFVTDDLTESDNFARKRQTPGSTAFVPSVAGLIIAGEVVNDLCKTVKNHSIL